MSTSVRTPRVRHAVAMLPLALLAGVWVNAAINPLAPAPSARGHDDARPRWHPSSPEPASVSRPTEAVALSPLVRDTVVADVGSPSDIPVLGAGGLPARRVGARHRRPRLPDPLGAGGRGGSRRVRPRRHAGSRLNAKGVAKPAILGPRLDGSHQTARLRDSDAGLLDGDQQLSTVRSGRCSSSRPPGRRSASTPTATAGATPRTSTTPPWPPRSTCAREARTSRPTRVVAPRCTATTTATRTSTWCCA